MTGRERHAQIVERYLQQHYAGPCHIERADWPYNCAAMNKYPGHVVYVCRDHLSWWHESDKG